MGSILSRNIRDLFEIAGCDGISHLDTSTREGMDDELCRENEVGAQPNPRPCTPVPHHRTRLLGQDPRSPSVGIVRTPIEVVATPFSNKSSSVNKLENSENETQRNYLETDLDSLHDCKSEVDCTPVGDSSRRRLPPGLSSSHLLKLKFLGMDPRSPSEGIVRTPIQVPHRAEDSLDENSIKSGVGDTSSICSSRSLFDCSDDYLDISKACTEPSAVLSDYEITKDWDISLGLSDHEEEEITSSVGNEEPSCEQGEEPNEGSSKGSGDSVSSSQQELTASIHKDITLLKGKAHGTTLSKTTSGVVIFREESSTPQNTPKKKSTRTPLTPICNLTPSDVRSKKSRGKRTEKEKLVCKILSGNENTPTKHPAGLVKRDKKSFGDENTKHIEWDQDTTVII